jgi:hypothetical protein
VGLQGRIGKLASIFPDKKYTDAEKFIKDYFSSYVQKAVELHKTASKEEKFDQEAPSRYVYLNTWLRQTMERKRFRMSY